MDLSSSASIIAGGVIFVCISAIASLPDQTEIDQLESSGQYSTVTISGEQ